MKRIKCQFCGRGFLAKNNYAKFCSSRCRHQYWRKNNPDKVAAHNFFMHKKFDAIVCGHCESLVKWALIHDKKTIIDLFNRYIDHATCLLAKSYNTGKGK